MHDYARYVVGLFHVITHVSDGLFGPERNWRYDRDASLLATEVTFRAIAER